MAAPFDVVADAETRAFEAAARHQSFTAAAAELHVTQSAISQQVKALEEYLGRALFVRRPRSLRLSDAGRAYLPVVTRAFTALASLAVAPTRAAPLAERAK